MLVYFARRWWLAHRQRVAEREAEHAAIAARADQEQAWVLAGRAVPVRATAPHRTQLPSTLCSNMTGTACAGPAARQVLPAGRYDQGGVVIDAWPVA